MNFALVVIYKNEDISVVVMPFSIDIAEFNKILLHSYGEGSYHILDTDTDCNRLKVSAYDMMHFMRNYDKLLKVKADWDTRRTIQETKD